MFRDHRLISKLPGGARPVAPHESAIEGVFVPEESFQPPGVAITTQPGTVSFRDRALRRNTRDYMRHRSKWTGRFQAPAATEPVEQFSWNILEELFLNNQRINLF